MAKILLAVFGVPAKILLDRSKGPVHQLVGEHNFFQRSTNIIPMGGIQHVYVTFCIHLVCKLHKSTNLGCHFVAVYHGSSSKIMFGPISDDRSTLASFMAIVHSTGMIFQ